MCHASHNLYKNTLHMAHRANNIPDQTWLCERTLIQILNLPVTVGVCHVPVETTNEFIKRITCVCVQPLLRKINIDPMDAVTNYQWWRSIRRNGRLDKLRCRGIRNDLRDHHARFARHFRADVAGQRLVQQMEYLSAKSRLQLRCECGDSVGNHTTTSGSVSWIVAAVGGIAVNVTVGQSLLPSAALGRGGLAIFTCAKGGLCFRLGLRVDAVYKMDASTGDVTADQAAKTNTRAPHQDQQDGKDRHSLLWIFHAPRFAPAPFDSFRAAALSLFPTSWADSALVFCQAFASPNPSPALRADCSDLSPVPC